MVRLISDTDKADSDRERSITQKGIIEVLERALQGARSGHLEAIYIAGIMAHEAYTSAYYFEPEHAQKMIGTIVLGMARLLSAQIKEE